jgi:nitroreductase
MDVRAAIQTKRAVREFRQKPLPAETIQAILYAGRRAQSSKNTQPWHFIVIQEPETLQALSELGTYAGHLAGAALGVAIATPDPSQRWSIMFDAGQAASYMQLAAWELGVASCLATIYDVEPAKKLLAIPTELELHVAISFGYPTDQSALTTPPSRGGRRPLQEVVHYESW